MVVNIDNEEVFKMKKIKGKSVTHTKAELKHMEYVEYLDELLQMEERLAESINGYTSSADYMDWLTYNAGIRGLKVIIVFSMGGGFDSYALIDDDEYGLINGNLVSTRFMKGTVQELIQYLVVSFNESVPPLAV